MRCIAILKFFFFLINNMILTWKIYNFEKWLLLQYLAPKYSHLNLRSIFKLYVNNTSLHNIRVNLGTFRGACNKIHLKEKKRKWYLKNIFRFLYKWKTNVSKTQICLKCEDKFRIYFYISCNLRRKIKKFRIYRTSKKNFCRTFVSD